MAEDEKQPVEPTLMALARDIAVWFPELHGRAIAVSEIDIIRDKTNLPSLPLAAIALVSEVAEQSENGSGQIIIRDDILIHFVFEPVKYTRADGKETPFYAFYDYETLRDRLLERLKNWRTPRGGGLAYISLDVESDEYAVYIAFRFRAKETWCNPNPDIPENELPHEVVILSRILQPAGSRKDCCDPCPDEPNPCDFAQDQ
jgi:hypothetical protein